MPDPTTPPPLDDREKVARAVADALTSHWRRKPESDRMPCSECTAVATDAALAVLDLPARDRDTARAHLAAQETYGERAPCGCDLTGPVPPAVHIVDRHEEKQ